MSHCALEATLKPKRFEHTENCYNLCLRRESVLGGCSKDVARQQQSFCHQMCCASVEQHTIYRWTSGVDVLDLPKLSVCHQPSTEVPGRTKTSKRNMPAWSQCAIQFGVWICRSTIPLCSEVWIWKEVLSLGHSIWQLFTWPSSPTTRFGNSFPASTAYCISNTTN